MRWLFKNLTERIVELEARIDELEQLGVEDFVYKAERCEDTADNALEKAEDLERDVDSLTDRLTDLEEQLNR